MQELKINAWNKQLKQNWKQPRMVNEHSDQTLFVSLKGMHLCSVSVLNRMSRYLHPEHLGKFLSLGSISSFGAGRNLGNKDQSSSALLNQVLLTFWAGGSLLWGLSCTFAGCCTASLISAPQMSAPPLCPSIPLWQLKVSPNFAKCPTLPPIENHCSSVCQSVHPMEHHSLWRAWETAEKEDAVVT